MSSLCGLCVLILESDRLFSWIDGNLFIRTATKTVTSNVGTATTGYQRAGAVNVVIPKIDYPHGELKSIESMGGGYLPRQKIVEERRSLALSIDSLLESE